MPCRTDIKQALAAALLIMVLRVPQVVHPSAELEATIAMESEEALQMVARVLQVVEEEAEMRAATMAAAAAQAKRSGSKPLIARSQDLEVEVEAGMESMAPVPVPAEVADCMAVAAVPAAVPRVG